MNWMVGDWSAGFFILLRSQNSEEDFGLTNRIRGWLDRNLWKKGKTSVSRVTLRFECVGD